MKDKDDNKYCKPMTHQGFYPWGAKFCHDCGKPYTKADIKKANTIKGDKAWLL